MEQPRRTHCERGHREEAFALSNVELARFPDSPAAQNSALVSSEELRVVQSSKFKAQSSKKFQGPLVAAERLEDLKLGIWSFFEL